MKDAVIKATLITYCSLNYLLTNAHRRRLPLYILKTCANNNSEYRPLFKCLLNSKYTH